MNQSDSAMMDHRLKIPDIASLGYEFTATPAVYDSQFICECVDSDTSRSFSIVGAIKNDGIGITADNESPNAIYDFEGKTAYYSIPT